MHFFFLAIIFCLNYNCSAGVDGSTTPCADTLMCFSTSLWWTRWNLERQYWFENHFFKLADSPEAWKISLNQLKCTSVSLGGLISIHLICQSYLLGPSCTSSDVFMHIWLCRLIEPILHHFREEKKITLWIS